ncbi:MAG: collagenase-like protease, partial [Bacteroidaceae bacterium]|nr:collagenase-like protease [Bacteroidaceae bacterium]
TEWRRAIVEKMKNEECRMKNENDSSSLHSLRSTLHDNLSLTYLGNVSNHLSRSFYHDRGFQHIEPAFELSHQQGVPVMFCKHCIRYALGWCYKRQNFMTDVPSQLFLRLENGKRFALEFDCKACMMKVIY